MQLAQIQLVQETFAQLQPQAMEFAAQFYERLFTLDPTLKPLFKSDPRSQQMKLIASLQLVINGLTRPQTIVTAVKQLGRRHVGYGVRDEHYHTVGEALLWTIAQFLGEGYTADVAAAWYEAYYLLAGLMKEAAVQTPAA